MTGIEFLRDRIEKGLPLYQGDVDVALAEARKPYEAAVDALAAILDHHDNTTDHDDCLFRWEARAALRAVRGES